jgi:hypothetical protein
MPSRRRTPSKSGNRPAAPGPAASFKAPDAEVSQTALQRFAAALAESEEREKAAKSAERARRDEAARVAAESAAHERNLQQARRDLDRAIAAVKQAKQNGRSTVAADEEWKRAKALVLQLETGVRPKWAPPEPVVEAAEVAEAETASESANEETSSPDGDESRDYASDGSE